MAWRKVHWTPGHLAPPPALPWLRPLTCDLGMLPEGRDQEAVGETLSAKHVQGLLTFSQLGIERRSGVGGQPRFLTRERGSSRPLSP